jgi:cobalt-zinc-cadmium efflux system outer membrane protein
LENLADLADRHYRLGAIPLQTFLDAQRQVLGTGKTLRQAQLDALSFQLDLDLLCGNMAMPQVATSALAK